MTPQKSLDHKGNFLVHPFAELLVEISHARLSGSLRISHAAKKSIIYFNGGAVVYAVSNMKAHRLFNILLQKKRLDQKTLSAIPNFTNDLELSAELAGKGLLSKEEVARSTVEQIEAIIVEALSWPGGEWEFSALARLRQDMVFQVDLSSLLADYARCMPSSIVSQRFKSIKEAFLQRPGSPETGTLQPHESFTLEQFNGQPLTVEQLRAACSIPETGLLQALYVLWLGGFLLRRDWNSAFSETKIAELLSAKVSLVKSASVLENQHAPKPETAEAQTEEPAAEVPAEVAITLKEYLKRMSEAETHYDRLGVADDADAPAIKNAYFILAKSFHPDRYHREDPVMLRRIQVAFTELAHAYETLKAAESRETYDYKVRKELEKRAARKAEGLTEVPDAEDRQSETGLDNFEQGIGHLADEEYAAAAACLARAVHYSPQNALYHAYYGKALSASEKYRHKAESEMQTAAKLDPKNPKIRIMLAEFFIDMNMKKRAEGELNRFLELVPDNTEARKLLESLAN